MREEADDERNWFARWEEELPSPEELMPLHQSLITPDLALAFHIPTPNTSTANPPPPSPPPMPEFLDSGGSGSGGAAEEPSARTLKRARLVWTPQLHKRFVEAVGHLGINNAVPKTIMQLMSVDGLTRENVASHLQKYRLYLKRIRGPNSSPAPEDHLFASAAVPPNHNHQFLARGTAAPGAAAPGPTPQEPFFNYAALQHRQNLAASAAAVQQQYYLQRQVGQFVSPVGNTGFDRGFLVPPQPGVPRMAGHAGFGTVQPPPLQPEDLDSASGGWRVLTLFPNAADD